MTHTQQDKIGHKDHGLRRLLKFSVVYEAFQQLVGAKRMRDEIVKEYIRPQSGMRILDVGCGPASMYSHFPTEIGLYYGVDGNASYIDDAKTKYGRNSNIKLETIMVERLDRGHFESFDVVIANSLLHHLNDKDARHLIQCSSDLLRPGGKLITIDGAWETGQSKVAHWMLANDRGQCVRTVNQYLELFSDMNFSIDKDVRHDLLRIPYTHLVVTAQKRNR